MNKEYTVAFSRQELEWLTRHLEVSVDKMDGQIKNYTQPVGKRLNEEQNHELTELYKHQDQMKKFVIDLNDTLGKHDKVVLARLRLIDELEEAKELVGDDADAITEVERQLKLFVDIPSINMTFDRNTLKFTLKLIENDLHKFRTSTIPNYEKSDSALYTDRIRTKTYHVNKARKAKSILEKLKTKLEKGL